MADFTPGSDEWKVGKEKLGMAFPNLPHLTHGEFKISESIAV
jgi:hypothetical protein